MYLFNKHFLSIYSLEAPQDISKGTALKEMEEQERRHINHLFQGRVEVYDFGLPNETSRAISLQ